VPIIANGQSTSVTTSNEASAPGRCERHNLMNCVLCSLPINHLKDYSVRDQVPQIPDIAPIAASSCESSSMFRGILPVKLASHESSVAMSSWERRLINSSKSDEIGLEDKNDRVGSRQKRIQRRSHQLLNKPRQKRRGSNQNTNAPSTRPLNKHTESSSLTTKGVDLSASSERAKYAIQEANR